MIVSKFHNFKPVEALAKDPYNSKERNKELVLLKILAQKHLLIILKLISSQLTSEQATVTCSVREPSQNSCAYVLLALSG